MVDINNFDEIRPFHDEEVNGIIKHLVELDFFPILAKRLFPDQEPAILKHSFLRINSIFDFQTKIIYPILKKLLKETSNGLSYSGIENIDKGKSYLFISNHHDIVLDPSILNVILYENGFSTTKVAIGDNLLNKDWIRSLARLNKSFIVHRNPSMKTALLNSQRLSNFIKHSIIQENCSVWIAQREGRAKDGNDVTQVSLLKMLAFGGGEDRFEYLRTLNIVPVAISYEYDPCDLLKIKEILIKEKGLKYIKGPDEDLKSMVTGLTGAKGRIHVSIGKIINKEFDSIIQHETPKEQYSALAAVIDEQIQTIIKLWPSNYIAFDQLMTSDSHATKYNPGDRKKFLDYLENKLQKAALLNEESFGKILSIYANPTKNKIRLTEF